LASFQLLSLGCGEAKSNSKKLSAFSRSDGEFLVVLDDKKPDFYDVELPWTGNKDRTPDKGKLFKRYPLCQ
jgi:hypothetical protein